MIKEATELASDCFFGLNHSDVIKKLEKLNSPKSNKRKQTNLEDVDLLTIKKIYSNIVSRYYYAIHKIPSKYLDNLDRYLHIRLKQGKWHLKCKGQTQEPLDEKSFYKLMAETKACISDQCNPRLFNYLDKLHNGAQRQTKKASESPAHRYIRAFCHRFNSVNTLLNELPDSEEVRAARHHIKLAEGYIMPYVKACKINNGR